MGWENWNRGGEAVGVSKIATSIGIGHRDKLTKGYASCCCASCER